jgi:putative membrane protein insertion efficiency factor
VLSWVLAAYRAALRPFFGPSCRFEPSCSHYAEQAIALHGLWRGTGLALKRIGRCHPWGGQGPDPVP